MDIFQRFCDSRPNLTNNLYKMIFYLVYTYIAINLEPCTVAQSARPQDAPDKADTPPSSFVLALVLVSLHG
jgi:hypothetical protein